MPELNKNRNLKTKLSLFFESKASVTLLQLSVLVSLLFVCLGLKSTYSVYHSQNIQKHEVMVKAQSVNVPLTFPEIDFSVGRVPLTQEIVPSYNPLTSFKIKEAAIVLMKRGHITAGLEILKQNTETRKLGYYLESINKKQRTGSKNNLSHYLEQTTGDDKR